MQKVKLVIVLCVSVCAIISSYYLSSKPIPKSELRYVDNQLCLQCHQQQAQDWQQSHHAAAMMHANARSVKADFNQRSFQREEVVSEFLKQQDHYYIHTQGPDGRYHRYPIKYTLGVAPLQQYLIELPGGRLQAFPVAWASQQQQWIDLYPVSEYQHIPPQDVLHWSGPYQNANRMCISCHTTNYQKNYDAKQDVYHSTWSDMNVGCQACHGPGSWHVALAASKGKLKNFGLLVNFKIGNPQTVVDTCGMCHARRQEISTQVGAGHPLLDHYLPSLLSEGLYYPDGQQQAEVYVYNSYRQSKMFQMGVTCVDCHQAHSGRLKYPGNSVCTQCHQPNGDARFKSAHKLYDDPSHTFHAKESPGGQCVKCHMPSKKYMQIHARPDHSIRIPRPDLSMKLGTPNACTQCHTDKSDAWANEWLQKWYGRKQASLHYGEVIAAGRAQQPGAEKALIALVADMGKPAVVRATALDLLAHFSEVSIATSITHASDKDPAVRRAAITGLEKLPLQQRLQACAKFLTDPIRAVRIEAARILLPVPKNMYQAIHWQQFTAAIKELIDAELHALDMPGSNLNLGAIAENLGKFAEAETYYLRALRIDASFMPARMNLVHLYSTRALSHAKQHEWRAAATWSNKLASMLPDDLEVQLYAKSMQAKAGNA